VPAGPDPIVGNAEATKLLIDHGLSPTRAASFVASFDDSPIVYAPVQAGDTFLRYTDIPDSQGSFLTNTQFSSPPETVNALALDDFDNKASLVQTVTANYDTRVLQGGIRGGTPGVQQNVIIDRNSFSFSQGVPY
jgi:hypothetical protein